MSFCAAVAGRHAADLDHVGADALVGVAPEEMHVGVLGRDLPGLLRAAAEIELGIGLLQRMRPDLRALQLVELAVEGHRAARRPQRLQDRDLLVHDLVALFLAPLDAFRRVLGLALAGDQVDADAAARELVEGRDHLRQQHRIDVARPRRHQHADRLGARHHHGARDPRLPAGGLHRHQHVFEARRLGRLDDAVEQRQRRRHLRARQPIGRGVARGRQEPAEFQSAPVSLHASIVSREPLQRNWRWPPRPRRGTIRRLVSGRAHVAARQASDNRIAARHGGRRPSAGRGGRRAHPGQRRQRLRRRGGDGGGAERRRALHVGPRGPGHGDLLHRRGETRALAQLHEPHPAQVPARQAEAPRADPARPGRRRRAGQSRRLVRDGGHLRQQEAA